MCCMTTCPQSWKRPSPVRKVHHLHRDEPMRLHVHLEHTSASCSRSQGHMVSKGWEICSRCGSCAFGNLDLRMSTGRQIICGVYQSFRCILSRERMLLHSHLHNLCPVPFYIEAVLHRKRMLVETMFKRIFKCIRLFSSSQVFCFLRIFLFPSCLVDGSICHVLRFCCLVSDSLCINQFFPRTKDTRHKRIE